VEIIGEALSIIGIAEQFPIIECRGDFNRPSITYIERMYYGIKTI